MATQGAQGIGLGLGFDAFGHHAQPQRARQRHHGAHHGGAGAALVGGGTGEGRDETAINLEREQREAVQVPQRRVAGAKVVQRQRHAVAAQLVEQVAGALGVVDQGAFGDFHAQARGRQARGFEHVQQLLAKLRVAKVARRHVQAQVAGEVGLGGNGLAGGSKNLPVDGFHAAAVFGHLQKVRRCQQAFGWVLPAHQGFIAPHLPVFERHDGLEVRHKLALLEGRPQGVFEGQHAQGIAVQMRVVQLKPAPAIELGAVHRRVGVAQQIGGGRSRLVAHHDADADGREQLLTLHHHGLVQHLQHAPRRAHGGFQRLGVAQQHGKLVTAHAGDHVRITQRGQQAPPDFLQHRIARMVAHAFVDELEAVHIHKHHRKAAMLVALQACLQPGQALQQVAAVGQAGQGIVHHLVLQLGLDALAHGDLLLQLACALGHALRQLGVGALQ